MAIVELLARLADCANWDSSGGGLSAQRAAALGSAILDSLAESGESCMIQPVGSVTAYAGNVLPDGWLWCDGSEYLVADYPELAAALHAAFLNADTVHFSVPALGDRFPAAASMDGLNDNVGETGGQANVTLNELQMPTHSHQSPPHTHSVNDPGHTHDIDHTTTILAKANSAFGNSNNLARASTTTGTVQNVINTTNGLESGVAAANAWLEAEAVTINNAGGGLSHTNMPPYLVLNYIIRAR